MVLFWQAQWGTVVKESFIYPKVSHVYIVTAVLRSLNWESICLFDHYVYGVSVPPLGDIFFSSTKCIVVIFPFSNKDIEA